MPIDVEHLVNQHKDAVYRQMVRVCKNYEDAEDALAEAIYAAVKTASQIQSPEHFQAWLTTVGSRSCARSRVKKRLKSIASLNELEAAGIEVADSAPDLSDSVESKLLRQCVAGAIELLPPGLREVYIRREILSEPAAVVGNALGLSIPALKSRLHRARELVRASLDGGLGCRGYLES